MFKHKGINIEVNSSGRFIATVDDLAINTTTLADAKTAIDKALAARAKPALSLAVVGQESDATRTYTGKDGDLTMYAGTLTGINRTTRALVLDPLPAKGREVDFVIPDTPANREFITAYMVAKEAMAKMDAHKESQKLGCHSYGRIDIEEYQGLLDEIKARYDKALTVEGW